MYNKLLDIAVQTSYFAGSEIIKVYNSYYKGTKLKLDKSLVTNADLNANKVIMNYLAQTKIPIISEENITDLSKENISFRINSKQIWMVDPLDGTSEFVNGGDEFTVNIALIENNEVVLGVVFVPVTNELYFAHKNIGSFKYVGDYVDNYREKSIKLPFTKTNIYTIVASKLNNNKETKKYIKKISSGKEVKYMNRSSSLKFCMIAEGSADIYPRISQIKEWDTAAAHAVVKFAGKNVYSIIDNKELRYNKITLLNPPFVVK